MAAGAKVRIMARASDIPLMGAVMEDLASARVQKGRWTSAWDRQMAVRKPRAGGRGRGLTGCPCQLPPLPLATAPAASRSGVRTAVFPTLERGRRLWACQRWILAAVMRHCSSSGLIGTCDKRTAGCVTADSHNRTEREQHG